MNICVSRGRGHRRLQRKSLPPFRAGTAVRLSRRRPRPFWTNPEYPIKNQIIFCTKIKTETKFTCRQISKAKTSPPPDFLPQLKNLLLNKIPTNFLIKNPKSKGQRPRRSDSPLSSLSKYDTDLLLLIYPPNKCLSCKYPIFMKPMPIVLMKKPFLWLIWEQCVGNRVRLACINSGPRR